MLAKSLRKDYVGVSTLFSGGITDSFTVKQSVSLFMDEHLTDVLNTESPYPSIPDVSFSTTGIYKQLCILTIKKSSSLDKIP